MSVSKNGNPRSDTPQKEAFADFLKTVKDVDPSTISTKDEEVDVVAKIGGIYAKRERMVRECKINEMSK